jgi:hypothetical protein
MTNKINRQFDQRARQQTGFDSDFDYSRARASWHLEKGVSISIIVVLLLQAASGVWFASKMTQQVEQNTNDISAMKADEKDREKTRAEMIANLSSINQELRDIREIMFQSPGRANQIIMPSSQGGNQPPVIIQQAPASSNSMPDRLSLPNGN